MHWFDKVDRTQKPSVDLNVADATRRREIHQPTELADVLQNIAAWMEQHSYSRKELFAVTLALQEAATNACYHGNRGDASKRVAIDYLVLDDEVLVRVTDEGRGFEPGSVPNPYRRENFNEAGSRGLMLIRAYSRWVRYDAPGNRVTFARRRSGR